MVPPPVPWALTTFNEVRFPALITVPEILTFVLALVAALASARIVVGLFVDSPLLDDVAVAPTGTTQSATPSTATNPLIRIRRIAWPHLSSRPFVSWQLRRERQPIAPCHRSLLTAR